MPTVRELPDAMAFSERLNSVLRARGYTSHGASARLANEYGVARPTVSGWCTGKYLPAQAKVRRMAREWNVPEAWLYWGEGPAPALFHVSESPPAYPAQGSPARLIDEEIDAMRYVLSGLVAVMAADRPAEGARMAAAIRRQVPALGLHNELLQAFLTVLDAGARKAKRRRGSASA